jgi:hypothetical protein
MTISKLTRLARHSCLLGAIFLLYNSCGPKIFFAGPYKEMTINISGLFANCHNPLSSAAPIPFKGSVQVYNFDVGGNNSQAGDYKEFYSGSNPAATVTVKVNVPEKNFFSFKIIAQGSACSTCTPTQVGNWTCIQAGTSGGISAAKPQWELSTGIWTSYQAVWNLTGAGWWQYAVANSCGCVVPY